MTDQEFTNEFKYIIEDIYKLYFGVKCTYREILESDNTYTRFKAVCRQCLITEVDEDTTLESHLYYLTPQDREAEVYRLLGARIKLSMPATKKWSAALTRRTAPIIPELCFPAASRAG